MRRACLFGSLFLLLIQIGCSPPPEVEVLSPVRGDLERSFTEQARTRLSQTYQVPMPVDGRLSRLTVEEGDPVRAGQVLASIDPVPLSSRVDSLSGRVQEYESRLLTQQDLSVEESQTRQAQARWRAEQQTRRALAEQLLSAQAALRQARTETRRAERLFEQGFIPRQQLEEARLAEVSAAHAAHEVDGRVQAQDAVVAAAARQVETSTRLAERRLAERGALQSQLQSARADLRGARHEAAQANLVAPVDGLVLKRLETGPGHFPAGTRILEIGRMQDLEVLAEVLTQDAMTLKPGTPVQLQAWDSGPPFRGTVRLLEPAGFTKPSSLGVEQQRVKVIVRFDPGDLERLRRERNLGVGYRVRVKIETAENPQALVVPRSALFRGPGGAWQLYAVRRGRAEIAAVRIGILNDEFAEVLEGLEEGEPVVPAPDTNLSDGQRVTAVVRGERPARERASPQPSNNDGD